MDEYVDHDAQYETNSKRDDNVSCCVVVDLPRFTVLLVLLSDSGDGEENCTVMRCSLFALRYQYALLSAAKRKVDSAKLYCYSHAIIALKINPHYFQCGFILGRILARLQQWPLRLFA